MRSEWDERKAKANLKKHGISFEEAESAIYDPFAVTLHDPDHSDAEDRWLIIGFSDRSRILTVIATRRNGRNRIISARKATKREIKEYDITNTR